MIVVDASAFGALILPDEASMILPGLDAELARGSVVVPRHWIVEVGNLLLVAKRRGRIGEDHEQIVTETLRSVLVEEDIEGDPSPGSQAWQIAETYGLSLYDALYLELAVRKRATLATNDRALMRAAKSSHVALFGR